MPPENWARVKKLFAEAVEFDPASRDAFIDRACGDDTELRAQLLGVNQQLTALSPAGVLQRGFAVVTRADGKNVRSASEVSSGDDLRVQVSDGEFGAQVTAKDKKNRRER